ncbi:hypothetical protein N0V88_000948 [Collariella sp. IMI 366227]|nr:hypothetical protein N0V88_000948 [Collariella sp. IMI 366227]
MTFPNRGHGHVAHSSTGSLAMSTMSSYSPIPADETSTNILTAQMNKLCICGGNAPLEVAVGNPRDSMILHPVRILPDTLGYCFVREKGFVTRLVPVDMLPFQLQGIPAREAASERLVPLPVPRGVDGEGRSSNMELLKALNMPILSSDGGGDEIQSTIDHILASTPPSSFTTTPLTAATANILTPHFQTSPYTAHNNNNRKNNQSVHHQPKRMKVYCDKWVHEGVCAFTQQGCKYKHEMPSDRATQHQLGLFLGSEEMVLPLYDGLPAPSTPNTTTLNTALNATNQPQPNWRPKPPSDTSSDTSQYQQQGYDGAGYETYHCISPLVDVTLRSECAAAAESGAGW